MLSTAMELQLAGFGKAASGQRLGTRLDSLPSSQGQLGRRPVNPG